MIHTDQEIKKDVVDQLYWDYKVDASDVQVEVSDGKVTLTGTVPSYTARNAVAADVWEIAGVKRMTNLLTVRLPSTAIVPKDSDIKGSAENALAWSPDIVDSDAIQVSVSGGAVRLEGTVDAYWKKWKVENLVSGLRGVTGVENHLAIVPSRRSQDRDIAKRIEASLERSRYVNAEDISVKVARGKVTLTGSASSDFARLRACDAAAGIPGVTDIKDDIAVV
jgi:osmotically-inducible protein OsmY